MSFWAVFAAAVVIILSLVIIALKESHAEIYSTLLSVLSVCPREYASGSLLT